MILTASLLLLCFSQFFDFLFLFLIGVKSTLFQVFIYRHTGAMVSQWDLNGFLMRSQWFLDEISVVSRWHFNGFSMRNDWKVNNVPMERRHHLNGTSITIHWNVDNKPLKRFEHSQDSLRTFLGFSSSGYVKRYPKKPFLQNNLPPTLTGLKHRYTKAFTEGRSFPNRYLTPTLNLPSVI